MTERTRHAVVQDEARSLAERHLASQTTMDDPNDCRMFITACVAVVESSRNLGELELRQRDIPRQAIYEICRILEDGLVWINDEPRHPTQP